MKKIICLVVVLLMIAAVAIAAKKVGITEKNLASLKGTWEGVLSLGAVTEAGTSSPVTLEILNDTVPVKAKMTLKQVPDQIASRFSIATGAASFENDDGRITSQGTLMWVGVEKNFFEVTLLDNKKLSVWYFFKGMRGDATLSKKK